MYRCTKAGSSYPRHRPHYESRWTFTAREGEETRAFCFVLNAAPLKHQNPAKDPPAKTDHRIGLIQEPYFSRPRFAKSQKVRGQITMTYAPTTIMVRKKRMKMASTPTDMLSSNNMIQCGRPGSERAEFKLR